MIDWQPPLMRRAERAKGAIAATVAGISVSFTSFLPWTGTPDNSRELLYFCRQEGMAMALFDEELPKRKAELIIGEDLSRLSIDELQERIRLLKAEIARVEAAVVAKQASLGVADSFFKR